MKKAKKEYTVGVGLTLTEKMLFDKYLPDDESMASFVRKLAKRGLAELIKGKMEAEEK